MSSSNIFGDRLQSCLLRSCLVSLILLVCWQASAQDQNWTHFRGSRLNGVAEKGTYPIQWSDSLHIAWKTDIRGKGWSSPVVFGKQVWITTASKDGKEMAALCLDFDSGVILQDIPLFRQDSIYGKHSVNTYATPTCCVEEGFVYCHFGSTGTACVNTEDFSVTWRRSDMKVEHVQGPGSSLVIYKKLLIVHLEGTDKQYIVAFDKYTGETVWKTERPLDVYEPLQPIGKKAYITPLIIPVAGRDLLISNGAAVCIAYDAATGQEVWRIVQGLDSTISMPFFENGILYFFTSFVAPPNEEKYAELLAVRPDGSGDITGTNILWRHKSPIIQLLTPVIKDGLIYFVDSRNDLMALDATTGEVVYSNKMKNKFNSSPVWAAGNIYFTSVKGETFVVKAGRSYTEVAVNKLPGEVFATPAFLRNSILYRNEASLYKLTNISVNITGVAVP